MHRLVMTVLAATLMAATFASAGVLDKTAKKIALVNHVKKQYKVKRSTARKIAGKLKKMPSWKQALKKGNRVVLGRHYAVNGKRNWSPSMSRYVGKTVRIKSFGYEKNNKHEPYVRVTGNTNNWRVRNLKRLSLPSDVRHVKNQYKVSTTKAQRLVNKLNTMSNSSWKKNLRVGSRVILGRHTSVGGKRRWQNNMDQYVGNTVRIEKLGYDSKNKYEPQVKVSGNKYSWRVRNLRKPSSSSGRSSDLRRIRDRYDVSTDKAEKIVRKLNVMSNSYWKKHLNAGDRVKLGRHHEVGGKKFWSSTMAKHVGDVVEVKSFGYESGNNYEPYIRVHGNSYAWRVRNLRKP